jgi:hypothetical protein
MPRNSTPRTLATKVVMMPNIPVANPRRIIIPSFPISPNEVINMPIPGKKLVSGRGIKIDKENIRVKKPMILSKIPVLKNINLGLSNFSILLKYTEDFSTILANITLSMVLLDIILGNFGAVRPSIICSENTARGIAIKLGKGGGNGIMIGREKNINTRPKPPAFIAAIIS